MRSFLIAVALLSVGLADADASTPLKLADSDGRPVADAWVRVWMPASGPQDLASRTVPLCEAKSAKDGTVPCSPPRLAGAIVTVDAPNFEPIVKILGETSLSRIVLQSGRTLKGRIVSPRDIPQDALAQARLSATVNVDLPERKQSFWFERKGIVGTNGELTIHGLPDLQPSIRLDVARFLPWLSKTQPGAVIEARLQPGVLLSGVVVDAATGDPVAGARIEESSDRPAGSVETGPAGRFEIGVHALPASLEAVAAGYRAAQVKVPGEDGATKLVVRLHPGEGITGTVFSLGGEDVERVTVWSESTVRPGATRTDSVEAELEDGAFRIDLPEPGVYAFRFDSAGYKEESLTEVRVEPRTYVDVGKIILRTGGGAAGTVIDGQTGEAVSGAVVELQPTGSSMLRELRHRRVSRGVTSETGEFRLTGVGPGRYILRIQASAYPALVRALPLEDEVAQLGQIVLGAGAPLSGIVEDRAGTPQAGVAVRFFDDAGESVVPLAEATTRRDGRFGGVHLEPGQYIARVVSDRVLLSQPFGINESERDATLRLVITTVRLKGGIHRNGKPVAGGSVTLVEQLDPSERQGKIILSGGGGAAGTSLALGMPGSMVTADVSSEGEFVCERAAVGSMLATYRARDGRSWTRQVTVPDVAEPRVLIDLGGAGMEGMVVRQDGAPIGGAQLVLATESGRRIASGTSAESGRFEFSDLQDGPYSVTVRATGYRARTVPGILVSSGARAAPLRVELTPGSSGKLSVRLRRSDGSACASIPVTLLDGAGIMVRSLPTDSSGVRVFEDLPPGRYTVVWADPLAGAGASEPLDVGSVDPVEYAQTLGRGVRLLVESGSPELASAPIGSIHVFTSSGAEIASYLSGMAVGLRFPFGGRLTLGTLSPGSYRLRIGVGAQAFERAITAQSGDVIVSVP